MPLNEGWKRDRDEARTNNHWNDYDEIIKTSVNVYNRHLKNTPGFKDLDWLLVKAMIWTETGAKIDEWKSMPLQIGVPTDKGLPDLLNNRKHSDLIIPNEYRSLLSEATKIKTDPTLNIRAGIAYLFKRLANFGVSPIDASDSTVYTYTMKNEVVSDVASRESTTVEVFKSMNPQIRNWNHVPTGTMLTYRKVKKGIQIIGWKPVTTNSIASNYNGGGDENYAEKLEYCLTIIRELVEKQAASTPK